MVQPDPSLPPALRAAVRAAAQHIPAQPGAGAHVPAPLSRERGYYLPVSSADPTTLALQLAVTRALLTARSPEEIPRILATFVSDLGGSVFPALLSAPEAIPLDISLGVGPPMLPHADPVSPAAMQLAALLPQVVDDARVALERLQARDRHAHEAERDGLTGLLTRRAWMRALGAARPGASVALVDLDWFKSVNDTFGHAAGDALLRAAARLLTENLRPTDACGRYGGDELVVLAPATSPEELGALLDTCRAQWREVALEGAELVGFSIGIAELTEAGARAVLRGADRALYRAKEVGRSCTELATPADADEESAPLPTPYPPRARPFPPQL